MWPIGVKYFQPCLWAEKPAASSANIGYQIVITDIGGAGGSLWTSNGTVWVPSSGMVVLSASGITSSITGTTNKTALQTIYIPHGVLFPGVLLKIESVWSFTSSSNNKTDSIEFGTTLGGATVLRSATRGAGVATESPLVLMAIKSATVMQNAYLPSNSYAGGQATALADITVPDVTAEGYYLYLCGTLASAGETISVANFVVTLIYPV